MKKALLLSLLFGIFIIAACGGGGGTTTASTDTSITVGEKISITGTISVGSSSKLSGGVVTLSLSKGISQILLSTVFLWEDTEPDERKRGRPFLLNRLGEMKG